MADSKRTIGRDESRLQRQKRGIATRRELLRSARHVFARDGYEHARLEDIALRARKTRGAFYDHFQDKEDVFFAIFEEDIDRDMTEIGTLILGLPTIDQRIEALAEYLGGISDDLERILLSLEFKLYAVRHPRKRQRLAKLFSAMRLRTCIPEVSKLLPQLNGQTTETRVEDCLAIGGIVEGLALTHLFGGLHRPALVRYLSLCLRETLPEQNNATEK
jgi:AcrR family transcriptional regulator